MKSWLVSTDPWYLRDCYIYLELVDFYGKCRQMYQSDGSLWGRDPDFMAYHNPNVTKSG